MSNRIKMIEKSHGSDNTSGILSSEIQELAKRIVVIEKSHDIETSSVILSSEIQNLTERIVAMERSHYIETTSDILSSEIQNLTERVVAMEKSHYIETTSDILSSEIQNLTERIVAMEKSLETDRKPDIPSVEIQNLANRIQGIENILQQNVTRRLECIASFENIQSNLDVQMFDGRCYFIGRQYLSWSKTQAKCQLAGANLVTDPSQRLIDFLTEVIENHFWIGARKTNIGSFQWITNGETVYWNDRRWDGNHPYYNERNLCVYVNVGRRKWRDYDCNHRYNYVCEL
ncbi:uncharacterized protein LOC117335381 [Pecten maximus]|uniref:uncharacterized protein LOC117335381 n=1 Tax=Pecten maximus TaxID=6579 RepID=UPI00145908AE|nr:uncharacterized protein LOC117335381 [Pecten maximus]